MTNSDANKTIVSESSSIDAVISWVDGNDPIYQKKLQHFCRKNNINQTQAIEPTRINQVNEIYYCLMLLKKNAPWLRNIYIVTNQQTPRAIYDITDKNFTKKIKIIDQNDLLQKENITTPIFNSLSIEWLIWKIPNLSENFIYLNDDFFIIRPLQAKDFFHNNKLLLRGKWKVQSEQKAIHKIQNYLNINIFKKKIDPHRTWQEQSAKLCGIKKYFYLLEHAPFALNKQTFNTYLNQNPHALQTNASIPFRSKKHTSSIPIMLHNDLIKNRAISAKDYQTIMVNGATHAYKKIKKRLNNAKKNEKVAFVCIQSIDMAQPNVQKYMLSWLQENINESNY